MTSKKSSANNLSANYDFKFALKNLVFPSIVSFLASAVIFVLKLLDFIANYEQLDANGKLDIAKTFKSVANEFVMALAINDWGSNVTVGIAAICVGVLFALFAFAFLMKKNRVNMFLSSPIDRKTIFKNRVLASVILMAGSAVIPIIADIIINIAIFKDPAYIIWHGILMFAEYFMYMLVGFSLMSISMLACNTIIESLFFGAGIIWLPTVLVEFFSLLARSFLRGFPYSSTFFTGGGNVLERNIISSLSIINPVLFGKALGDYFVGLNMFGFVFRTIGGWVPELSSFPIYTTIGQGKKWAQLDIIAPILIWMVVCAGLLLIARALLIRRKAENAGNHATAKVPTTIFALEAGMLFSSLISEITLNNKTSKAFIFIICAISLAFAYYLTLVISKRKIKLEKSTHITVASSIGLVAVVSLVFVTGCFGYTSYTPKADEVKLAVIKSNVGEISGDESKYYGCLDNEYTYMLWGNNWNSGSYCVCQTEQDIEKLIDLNKQLYKKTDDMSGPWVSVVYVLKNGKKVERIFNTTDFNAALNIISLTDTEEYRSKLKNLMLDEKADCKLENLARDYSFINMIGLFDTMSEPEINYLYNAGKIKIITNDITTNLTIDNTLELRRAIYTDKMSVDSEHRFRPMGNPVCQVIFYDERNYQDSQEMQGDDLELGYYDFGISNTIVFYIDDSMTNTIEYLKSVGVYDTIMKTAVPDVQSVKYLDVKSVVENRMIEGVIDPIFNSSCKSAYKAGDIQPDDEDRAYSYVNQLGDGVKSIDDAKKAKELYANSRSFARITYDDYIAVFTLPDGTEISRLIYSDMM